MNRPLVLALFLGASLLQAQDLPLPAGVEVGEKLYSLPNREVSLEEAGWVSKTPADSQVTFTVSEEGLHIGSEEENPLLASVEEFRGDLLIQMRLSFDPKRNHFFRVTIFDRYGVEYNQQFKRFAFLEKSDPNPRSLDYDVVQQKKGELDTVVNDPGSFVLTVALTDKKAVVWADDLQLFSFPVEGLDAQGRLGLRGGWKSDWAIKAFDVYQLKKIP